jgi:uncharacterized protein (TIGR00369 family)
MGPDEVIEFMTEGFGRPFTWPIESLDESGLRLVKPEEAGELRPGGTISGPTVMALADAAAYMVLLSRIGPQGLAVTTNLNCDFIRRPRPGELVADASILKLGRTLALIDVMMSSRHDDGSLTPPVARASVTYSLALLLDRPEGDDRPEGGHPPDGAHDPGGTP